MKTFKPSKISVLWKTFELYQKTYFSVALLVLADIDDPPGIHTEVDIWRLAGRELGRDVVLDECMPKQRGEVLVNGRCYTPGGVPKEGLSVRVKIVTVDKTLYVFGDRTWGWHGAMSHPEPFTVMPVSWLNAFGGEGEAKNPVGRGMPPSKSGEPHRLPNIEDPSHLIKGRGDRPTPVGFGPYDLTWPQRWSKIGTYDFAWAKEHAPGFAPDIDLAMFNAAPEDQQIEGFFRGDEPFLIENMHPERARIEGRLPGVVGRCFVSRNTDEGSPGELTEIPTRLDTVRFFPDQGRVLLTFRGMTQVAEDDAADIVHLMAACEDLDAPRPVEHYEEVRRKRLDKRRGGLHSLRDGDLLPERAVTRKKDRRLDPREPEALLQTEGLLRKHLTANAQNQVDKVRQAVTESGGDPDALDLPDFSQQQEDEQPDLEDMASFVDRIEDTVEKQRAASELKRAEAEANARVTFAQSGIDYDAVTADARKQAAGPPRFSAQREIQRLRDIQTLAHNGNVATPQLDAALDDPTLRARLEKAERDIRDAYRSYAHYLPAAARLEGDERDTVRARVASAYAGGESFVDHDLTGADLSGLDLSHANFQGAFLEAANLSGAKLTEADFTGAVLARADLSGADLGKARLTGANLGEARLVGAKLGDGADLEGAVLAKADLSGADLHGARMRKVDLLETKLGGADVRGVQISEALFLRNDLQGVRFGSADLSHACFVEVDLRGADFTSANLTGTTFVTANADRAVFVDATFDNARIVGESSLVGADFRGARASRTNLRGIKMTGADLSGMTADQSDFSEADLTGANLYHLVARGAMFVRTDLTDASLVGADLFETIFQKSMVAGATFRGANLFRADFSRSIGDQRTSFERANVKHVRLPRKG